MEERRITMLAVYRAEVARRCVPWLFSLHRAFHGCNPLTCELPAAPILTEQERNSLPLEAGVPDSANEKDWLKNHGCWSVLRFERGWYVGSSTTKLTLDQPLKGEMGRPYRWHHQISGQLMIPTYLDFDSAPLAFLSPPVDYDIWKGCLLGDAMCSPQEKKLLGQIFDITEGGDNLVPKFTSEEPGSRAARMRQIVKRSGLSQYDGMKSKAQWHTIHANVLSIALEIKGNASGIECFNLTAACINEDCNGIGQKREDVLPQWADMVMVLLPSEASTLLNFTTCAEEKTLDVHKTSTTVLSDIRGIRQLRIWVSAFYARLYSLLGADVSIISIPFLIATEQRWQLYFACQKLDGEGADLVGPINFGATDSLQDAYMILAVLRVLVTWTNTTFREWAWEKLPKRPEGTKSAGVEDEREMQLDGVVDGIEGLEVTTRSILGM